MCEMPILWFKPQTSFFSAMLGWRLFYNLKLMFAYYHALVIHCHLKRQVINGLMVSTRKSISDILLQGWYKTPRKFRVVFWSFVRKFSNEESYQKLSFRGKTYVNGTDRFKSYKELFPVPPVNKSILDVGCNYGYYSFKAHEDGAAYCRTVEIDQRFIKKMQEVVSDMHLDHFDVVQADILNYVIDRDFDIVLCLNLIHHFPTIEQVGKLLDNLYQHTVEKMILIVLSPVDLDQTSVFDDEIDPAGGKRFLRISPNYFVTKYGQERVNIKRATGYGPNRYEIIIHKNPAA